VRGSEPIAAGPAGRSVEQSRPPPNPSPAKATQALAAHEDASLIVIGSSHRGVVGRVLAGATAERLLRGAPCPVAWLPTATPPRSRRRRVHRPARRLAAAVRAMVLESVGGPLVARELPAPVAGPGARLLRVEACGVCRTDLHLLDGEVEIARLPRVLGHQIVGRDVATGERLGVPWLGWTCGTCSRCRSGRENLCERARFTGRDLDGGFAELAAADARYCFPVPEAYPAAQAAPLLCAGLIGYRSLRLAGDATRLGLYGFGAAAHIVCQVARHEGREVYAFTRPGDAAAQAFAREVGAVWAGGSDEPAPERLDAAIVFAADGALVPLALRAVDAGGTVVCGGIHMSDIPSFPYAALWEERVIRSVANLTRRDGVEFLALAPQVPVRTRVREYPLERAGDALADLRAGALTGAAVVTVR
jgi:propanol-preferring alcohol dehydrogenase